MKSDLKKLCQDNEGLQCPLMNLVSPVGNGALDIQIEISDLHRRSILKTHPVIHTDNSLSRT